MLDERQDSPAKRVIRSISALNQMELFMTERGITSITLDEVVDQLAFWEDELRGVTLKYEAPEYSHVPPELISPPSSTDVVVGSRVIIVTCGFVIGDTKPPTSVARGAKGTVESISTGDDPENYQYVVIIDDAPDRSLIGRRASTILAQLVLLT